MNTATRARGPARPCARRAAATDRVVELYRSLYPDASPADRLISTLTDSNFRIRSLLLAERKVAQGRGCDRARRRGRLRLRPRARSERASRLPSARGPKP